jgi:hypothetical protein
LALQRGFKNRDEELGGLASAEPFEIASRLSQLFKLG